MGASRAGRIDLREGQERGLYRSPSKWVLKLQGAAGCLLRPSENSSQSVLDTPRAAVSQAVGQSSGRRPSTSEGHGGPLSFRVSLD